LIANLKRVFTAVTSIHELKLPAASDSPSEPFLSNYVYGTYFSGSTRCEPLKISSARNVTFLARLHQANASREGWDFGWTVEMLSNPRVVVGRQGGVCLRLDVQDVIIPVDAGILANTGTSCAVRVGRILFNSLPGYVLLVGDTKYIAFFPRDFLIRAYLLVKRHCIIQLVEELTHQFNDHKIPFRLKVIKQLEYSHRIDSIVMFLPSSFWTDARPLISAALAGCQIRSVEGPLFAKVIHQGFFVAQDPGNGLSFGQHRAEIVTKAFSKFATRGAVGFEAWLDDLESEFVGQGLNINLAHLSSKSSDIFN
jgi:hypothetical protein